MTYKVVKEQCVEQMGLGLGRQPSALVDRAIKVRIGSKRFETKPISNPVREDASLLLIQKHSLFRLNASDRKAI